jgi:hypothetical protein
VSRASRQALVALTSLAAAVASGAQPAPPDSSAAGPSDLERRFAALESTLAQARAVACAEVAAEVPCVETDALAEVAEELMQEDEAALAVALLEEALAVLGAPVE